MLWCSSVMVLLYLNVLCPSRSYINTLIQKHFNTILFTETIVDDVVIPPTAEGYTVDVLGFTEKFPTQYLVNLRGADTDVWDAYKSTPDPQIPIRVFA